MVEAILIIGLIAFYFFLMFFYPEWVGITGRAVKKKKTDRSSDKADFFRE